MQLVRCMCATALCLRSMSCCTFTCLGIIIDMLVCVCVYVCGVDVGVAVCRYGMLLPSGNDAATAIAEYVPYLPLRHHATAIAEYAPYLPLRHHATAIAEYVFYLHLLHNHCVPCRSPRQ